MYLIVQNCRLYLRKGKQMTYKLTSCCLAEIVKRECMVSSVNPSGFYYLCSICNCGVDEEGKEKNKLDYKKTWKVAGKNKRIADLENNHLLNILKWIEKQDQAVDYGGEDHIYVFNNKEEIKDFYNYKFIERQAILRGLIKNYEKRTS